MNFDQLLELLYNAKGITRLADVARELDVSPQAVSNWKARNQVPYKYVVIVKERFVAGELEGVESEESDRNVKPRAEELQAPMPYGPYGFPEEDEISLWEILDVLKENIRLILIIPTVTCILTIIYVLFIAQPVFTSSATIIPASGESSIGNLAGMAAQFGITVPGGNESAPSMVYPEIIQSRTLARKLLNRKFNTNEYGQNKTLLHILMVGHDEPEYGSDTLEALAIGYLQGEAISVEKDRQSSILTLTVQAFEPQLAADMATALIEELDEHQKQFNIEQAAKKRIFIEERIEEVRLDLETAEEVLKDWRQGNRNIGDSPALLLEQERLMRESEVQKSLYITLKQEYEMAKIEEVEESDIIYILDKPEVPLDRSSPKRKMSVLLAGFLGIGMGVVAAFIRNWYETSQDKVAE